MIDMAIPFPDISPFVFKFDAFQIAGQTIGPLGLRWYALAYISSLMLAWRLMLKLTEVDKLWAVTSPLSKDDIDDFLFYATLGVLLGGRIGYVLLYRPDMLVDPFSILRIWEGGMSFHGGFAGVCIAVIGTALGRKVSLWSLADVAAVVAPIGQFFGRIANFINQELYGRPTDLPWAFIFRTDPSGTPRHPSQLYLAALEGVVVFIIIQVAVRRFGSLKKPGTTAGLFIALYGMTRFIGEQFREPDAERILGFTRGEFYSMPMILAGIAIAAFALTRKPKPATDVAA